MTMNEAQTLGYQTIVGVFENVDKAESAINDLKLAGFTPDSISIITRDRDEQRSLTEASGNKAGESALVGALGGGTLGAVLGWLLAGGTALIPGVGPVIAAGIFGATATGAIIGGTLASIGSALATQGIPEHEAAEYEEHVKSGRTLLSVKAYNGQLLQSALDVFDRNDAASVRYYNEGQSIPGQVYTRGTISEANTGTTYINPSSEGKSQTNQGWTKESSILSSQNDKWATQDTVSTQTTSSDPSNSANVDKRDFSLLHSDSPTPDYRDETYRTGTSVEREQVSPGTEAAGHPGMPGSSTGSGTSTYDEKSISTESGYLPDQDSRENTKPTTS